MIFFESLSAQFGSTYKAGHVFFTRKDESFISDSIAFLTNQHKQIYGDKSHCGLCVGDCDGIEATSKGIHHVDLRKYFEDQQTAITFREPKMLEKLGSEAFVRIAKSMVGDKYDFKLILAQFLISTPPCKWLSDKRKQAIIDRIEDPSKYVCSEYVYTVLRECGFVLPIYFRNPSSVTPASLFQSGIFKQLKDNMNQLRNI